MFWIELLIVMAIIFWGVRKGGPFLAMAGGIGMFIMVFILRVKPSDPPTAAWIFWSVSRRRFCVKTRR